MIKVTYSEDYLQHHGIKGQKCGVENGPPYPLDKKSMSEDKKQYKKEVANITKLQKEKLSVDSRRNRNDISRNSFLGCSGYVLALI